MMKWLIATYIIIVLVFSAKAGAMSLESNPALINFTHPAKISTEIDVQDPLPESMKKIFFQMNLEWSIENSVGSYQQFVLVPQPWPLLG